LERGFKARAERTATSLRREMNLAPYAPILPVRLAELLDVKLLTPQDVRGLPQTALDQLLDHDPWGWSAISCLANGTDIVIYNPRHSAGRQTSDISHELAHILLAHDPGKLVLSQDGSMVLRSYDPKQEEEANWLGWTVLLPREALAKAAKAKLSIEQIAIEYGVTEQLARFRLQMTGVLTQFRR
jgi:hypothetical protein